jgi:S1-C subfamily serine protease
MRAARRKKSPNCTSSLALAQTNATKTFDTESAGSSYATGFVVDAARGIILTNRHVVQPGPVTAEASTPTHATNEACTYALDTPDVCARVC